MLSTFGICLSQEDRSSDSWAMGGSRGRGQGRDSRKSIKAATGELGRVPRSMGAMVCYC